MTTSKLSDIEKQQLISNTPSTTSTSKWTRYIVIGAILALASIVAYTQINKVDISKSENGINVIDVNTSIDEVPAVNMALSCGFRIRKSWDRYTPAEKARYLKAIQLAMSKGLYQRFVDIHGEVVNNKEAHGSSCVFLLWHRKYLLGFENMLRSLSPEFACVTLPYYDYVQHAVNRLSSKCNTMEECSPILREMGGSRGTPGKAVVGGRAYTNCVARYPVDHSCEDPTKSCLKCVPRGSWTTTMFPDIGYALIKRNLLDAKDFFEASNAIERNPHNMIHNALKGVMMDAYSSPAEPIFFSHHGTIDLLHAIYHKCKVTPLNLQGEALLKDPRNFVGCVQPRNDPNGRVITYESSVTMRSKYQGKPIPVDEDPDLKQYFVGLPRNYAQFTDTRNLGANSYSYEIPGLLGDLYTRCQDSDKSFDSLAKIMLNQLHLNKKPVEDEDDALDGPTKSKKLRAKVVPITKEGNIAYLTWRHEIALLAHDQNLTSVQTDSDLAKMVAYIYDKYLPGEVKDYSPEFKKMWRITEPSIDIEIVDGLRDGSHPIHTVGWEAVTEKYFGASICGTCKNCRYVNNNGSIDTCYLGWSAEQCSASGEGYTWCGDQPLPTNETCGTCKNCYYAQTEACYEGWSQEECTNIGYDWCGSQGNNNTRV